MLLGHHDFLVGEQRAHFDVAAGQAGVVRWSLQVGCCSLALASLSSRILLLEFREVRWQTVLADVSEAQSLIQFVPARKEEFAAIVPSECRLSRPFALLD